MMIWPNACRLLLLLLFLAFGAGRVVAGTFDLNTIKGLWQMSGNLSPYFPVAQSTLVPDGFSVGTAPGPRFSTESGNQFLILNSATTPYAGLKSTEFIDFPAGAGGNGPAGAIYANNWTVVMDVRFPSVTGNWKSLLQDVPNNANDSEIFLNSNGQIVFWGASGPSGTNPVASDALVANTWYRLAFTSTYDAGSDKLILRAYVNGVPTTQSSGGTLTSTPEGRYSLGTGVGLFSDDNGETGIVHVGAVGTWRRTLAAADISALGGFGNALTWSGILNTDATPPLAALTGTVLFGSVAGNYTPPTGAALLAMANSATASSYPGAVCDATLSVPAAGGTLPGVPNHSFDGDIHISVLANGDVAITYGGTILNYTPTAGGSAADLGVAGNVTYQREVIDLSPSGVRARQLTVFFPAGMTVALQENDCRAHDQVTLSFIPLNGALAPLASTLSIVAGDFPDGVSTLYPATERIPVRFRTASVGWATATGKFTFSQSGELLYHQERQVLATTSLLATSPSTQPASYPASNDRYFFSARNVTGPVVFGARSGGVATTDSLAMSLDPGKFFNVDAGSFTSHFPVMKVKWTGIGSLVFSNNAITPASNLPTAGTSVLYHSRATPTSDCKGQESVLTSLGAAYFLPAGRVWKFTPDGGLSAPGSLGGSYNSSTDTPSGVFYPRWGGFIDGSTKYSQVVTTGFTSGRMLVAGNAVTGTEVSGLSAGAKAFGLLHAGFTSPENAALVERPGSAASYDGLADYPGLNLRVTASGANAQSILAGVTTSAYPLATGSKYYLRPGGVSGLHLADGAASPISFTAYGSDFSLSVLKLAFLDGLNTDSGVNGGVVVKTPANTSFNLDFKKLIFGPQGQLQQASLANQSQRTLGYWNFNFTPLAIDFPQPKSCPPPTPSTGFVRLTATAKLPAVLKLANSQTVTGTLGFLNGDLVTATDFPDYPEVSRFQPGGQISLPGPDGSSWPFTATSGVYLNQYASSGGDAPSINVGGQINVPFFNDMAVHVRTRSASGDASPSLLDIRKAITTSGAYDASHCGRPSGVALDTYLTGSAYHCQAYRKWQDLITFSIPVAFSNGSNSFRSLTPKSDDVFLFHLSEAIPKMTPSHAELILDGQANVGVDVFLKQVNFTAIQNGLTLGASQPLIDGANDAISGLNGMLADDVKTLITPAIAAVAGSRGSATFFNTLKTSADRNSTLGTLQAGLQSDLSGIFNTGSSGIAGQTRRELESRITTVRNALGVAKGLVASANAMTTLASAIGSAISNSNPPALPDAGRLDDLAKLFDQASTDLESARTAIGPALNGAINQSGILSAAVSDAINDLRPKWAATDGTALYTNATQAQFANDLANAITDRLAGSAFAGMTQQVLREYLADASLLARQTVDNTLQLATTLLPNSQSSELLPALGNFSDSFGASGIKGYARFNGDSIDEIRLDGRVQMKIPDDNMMFDGFFLFKTADSSTPAGACLAAGGAAAEVSMGASGPLDWAGVDLDVDVAGKVALAPDGLPIGLCGDLKLVGEMDFSSIKLSELALGFGFGAGNNYLYGKSAGRLSAMDVAVGIFAGRTCDLAPIRNADEDIGSAISATGGSTAPYTGAAVYAYGAISLMPIIGIPPSCLLDLRVGGGQGFFVFETPTGFAGGYKTTQSVSGEMLCIASVTGQLNSVLIGNGHIANGSPHLDGVGGTSRFTAAGKVGVGPFSYTFKKSGGVILQTNPNSWRINF